MGILEILQSIGILGALVFSVLSFVGGIRRSRVPLVMRVRQFSVLWYKDNSAIVIFHLSFVNDSSRARIVDNVQVLTPPVVTHRQHPFQADESQKVAICRLPTGGDWKVPIPEVLRPPLDIPPHQSQNKMFALYLQFPQPSETFESLPYAFSFLALGIGGKLKDVGKPIATDSIWISLKQLRTVGYYPTQWH
jgi:hypothetical protein